MSAFLPKALREAIAFTIDVNEHKLNYQTVEEYLGDVRLFGSGIDEAWATPKSRQRAIDTDALVCIQWYPSTPVGFHVVYGASVAECLAAIANGDWS